MAQYKDILIRSVAYLNNNDKELVSSFLARKEKVPIYYQYCQSTADTAVDLPQDNLLGYATNLHVDNGMLLCDVEIIHLLKLANNFDGSIDNYVLSINRSGDKSAYCIDKFIVYDRNFKKKVEDKMEERMNELSKRVEEQEKKNKEMSVCMEIAGAESIPELGVEAQKAN